MQLDWTKNPTAIQYIADYLALEAEIKSRQTKLKEMKTFLIEKLGNHSEANTGTALVRNIQVEANEGTLITPEMVGTRINPKKPHTRFTIKGLK